jgi:hypothetical protein
MSIKRGEVIEVYNDLSALTADKIDQLLGRTREDSFLPPLSSSPEVVLNMPRDTLRVRLSGDDFSIICYPFFPSHLRLPAKVGEYVWVFLESLENASPSGYDPEKAAGRSNIRDTVMNSRNPGTMPPESNAIGYWMCRPASERQIEDLNYTAFGRVKYTSGFAMQSATDIQQNATRASRTPTFPSYSEGSDSLERTAEDDENLRLRIERFASSFNMEPVARYTRAPGETVIAGSNDARIVLGQVRSGGPAPAGSEAGSIDLVAGTGRGATAPNLVTNEMGVQEVDKDPLLTSKIDPASEGDPDFAEDLSRVLIAEYLDVDPLFPAAVPATRDTITDELSGPSIVARSRHIRLLSAEDGSARIVVEGPVQSSIVIDSAGSMQFDAGAAVNIRTPSALIASTAGSGASATSVIIESSAGFQSLLAASLDEITVAFDALGVVLPATTTLSELLRAKQFSSLVTKSD